MVLPDAESMMVHVYVLFPVKLVAERIVLSMVKGAQADIGPGSLS